MQRLKAGPSKADQIRDFVLRHYIEPARKRGEKFVTVPVGEVHNELGLKNRIPLVISAITARKFLKQHSLSVHHTEGPPSGQSTTVRITFSLEPTVLGETRSPLLALGEIYGIIPGIGFVAGLDVNLF